MKMLIIFPGILDLILGGLNLWIAIDNWKNPWRWFNGLAGLFVLGCGIFVLFF